MADISDISKPPRDANWEKDGIGITPEGAVLIKCDDSTNLQTTREYLVGLDRQVTDLQRKIDDMQLRVNRAEPQNFIPGLLATLRAEAFAMGCGAGERRAYRDCIGMIEERLPKA